MGYCCFFLLHNSNTLGVSRHQLTEFSFAVLFDPSIGIDVGSYPKNKALHSSCLDLKDGQHYLQPLTDEEFHSVHASHDESTSAPIVHAKCDFGYTIIDPSFDSDWQSYFSSIHQWQVNTIGPDLDDHASWSDWFFPSRIVPQSTTKRTLLRDHDVHQSTLDFALSISQTAKSALERTMTNSELRFLWFSDALKSGKNQIVSI